MNDIIFKGGHKEVGAIFLAKSLSYDWLESKFRDRLVGVRRDWLWIRLVVLVNLLLYWVEYLLCSVLIQFIYL